MRTRDLILVGVAVVLVAGSILWLRRRTIPDVARDGGDEQPSGRLESIDPSTILFSLPTLYPELPQLLTAVEAVPSQAIRLHEDDWRQIEFLPVEALQSIEMELGELRDFKEANSVHQGWKDVFVRRNRPHPLESKKITLARILELAQQPATKLFMGTGTGVAEVRSAFAIRLDAHAFLYGEAVGGDVVMLAVGRGGGKPLDSTSSSILSRIASTYGVVLVDWCGGTALRSAR